MLRSLRSQAGEGQGSARARFPLFTPHKRRTTTGEGSWTAPSTGCPALAWWGHHPGNDGMWEEAGLACSMTLVATEGPKGQPSYWPHSKPPKDTISG